MDKETLAMVEGMIKEAILAERQRLANLFYVAKPMNDGDYYKPEFSFNESMSEISRKMLKED